MGAICSLHRIGLAAVLMAAMVSAGCSAVPTRQQTEAAVGAMIGGVRGDMYFHNAQGALGGAAAGAMLGSEISAGER